MRIDPILLLLAVSSYSAILPLGLGVFKWKHLSFELKILSAYLLLSLLTDVVTLQLAINSINNLSLLYVFTVLEFLLFSTIYYKIYRSLRLKRVIIIVAIVFLGVVVFNLYEQGIASYATAPRTIESIIFTTYSIIYFYQIVRGSFAYKVEKDSMFWFNGGILVYFAGSLLFFSLSSYILEHASIDMQRNLFTTPAILNIVQKLLFTIVIWISPRKK